MSDYEKLKPALQKLVDAGTLNSKQALAAQSALRISGGVENRSSRSLFSEALTYIGGAVIVVSAGLLLSQAWDQLGTWGRPAVIGAAAAALFAAAYFLSRDTKADTIRRLSSTLFVGSAALVAFTIGLVTNEFWVPKNFADSQYSQYWVNPKPWVVPTIAILCAIGAGLVAVFGYSRTKSAFGVIAQIVTANVAIFSTGTLIYIQLFGEGEWPTYGWLGLLIAGGAWVYAAEKEFFAESNATAIGSLATLFIASQGFREQFGDWVVPTMEILGGFMFLALYLSGRKWPFLAGGIGALLIGGIELLTRYVEGIAGALGSMALGIALLVLGTRLFKEHE